MPDPLTRTHIKCILSIVFFDRTHKRHSGHTHCMFRLPRSRGLAVIVIFLWWPVAIVIWFFLLMPWKVVWTMFTWPFKAFMRVLQVLP